ncbi:hypothetical protein CSA56_10830 [candidate division KSB3 bacterium]|uniref:Energy-coupling factor transporter transmembrane protein EcfT n=1 Tax=candidate division KSB3 bacterium TaxID=2044937 RepID=A0A2G6KD42_9BACT|nr:MAG: hypothetical protein CSA56_10830 [candidate division KSB3 bacterium]
MSLDPRTKISGVVILLGTTFFVDHAYCLLGIGMLFIAAALVTKTSLMTYLRHLALISWLLGITFFFHVWSNDTSHVSRRIFSDGVLDGILAVGQLSVAVGWITILHTTSSPLELMSGFERLLRPLQRAGVPIHTFAILGMLSVRFLPIVFEEGRYLVQAYIARGIELHQGTVGIRTKNALLLCVPLLSMMLRRVEHITCAMDNRGFRVGRARTSFRKFRLQAVDYVVLGGLLGLLISCYLINDLP